MACWLVPASALHGKRVYWISEKKKEEEEGGLRNPLMGKKLGHLLQGAGVFFLTHEELQGCFWWLGARKLYLVY